MQSTVTSGDRGYTMALKPHPAVLLEHSHLLIYVPPVAAFTATGLRSCDRDRMACQAQTAYHWALYRKSLPSHP